VRSRRFVTAVAAVVAAGTVQACGAQITSSASSTTPASSTSTARPQRTVRHRRHRRAAHHLALAAHPSGLPVSHASSTVVQPQADAGSCHATGSGKLSEPDPSCTPGALSPAVTQATIDQTICTSGYSASVRPSEHITAKEKLASMAAYGDGGSPSGFEYDHLVSLELGGAANDPRNLWPEPGHSPNPKDSVEDSLHRLVCSGEMPLAQAQKIIATGWIAYFKSHGFGSGEPATAGRTARPSASSPAESGGPNKPISEINCSDFPTHADAQTWFDQHGGSPGNDVAGLDGDHDGLACESLP
jgi:Excalibur calcium-binding domain